MNNQLTNQTGGTGSMLIAGTINKQAIVSVAGNAAVVNHQSTNFAGYVNIISGTNTVQIIANDYNDNSATNRYQIVTTNNGVAKAVTFDLNGNEVTAVMATSTNVYQWDAADRLVSISGPTNQSLFTYDGLGRRVQIIEKTNGVAYATNKFVWCGQKLCEQRDLTGGTVLKIFFGEGEQIFGVNYFFTHDHLGSVTEMTDGSGAIQARYAYDPYGRRTKISGSLDADFAFTGDYYHSVSGLYLTLYRAYDSDLGRWLNQDPIGEMGGLNLYRFVGNDPINLIDRFGLEYQFTIGIGGTAGVGLFLGGGMSIGFTTSGQFIIQFQHSEMAGFGAFAGVGLQASIGHSNCRTKDGISTDKAFHIEGNIGEEAAVGGSMDIGSPEASTSGAYPLPIPKMEAGVGFGFNFAAGVSTTTTVAFAPTMPPVHDPYSTPPPIFYNSPPSISWEH